MSATKPVSDEQNKLKPRPKKPPQPTTAKRTPTQSEAIRAKFREILTKKIYYENTNDSPYKCINTLLTVVTNIVNDPLEEKYRRLPTDKPLFKSNLMSVEGGIEFLVALGFRKSVAEFKEVFLLSIPNLAKDEDKFWDQMGDLQIAQELLEENLEKAKEIKERRERAVQKEKMAEKKNREEVRKLIEADKERRAEQKERLRLKKLAQERQKEEDAEREKFAQETLGHEELDYNKLETLRDEDLDYEQKNYERHAGGNVLGSRPLTDYKIKKLEETEESEFA